MPSTLRVLDKPAVSNNVRVEYNQKPILSVLHLGTSYVATGGYRLSTGEYQLPTLQVARTPRSNPILRYLTLPDARNQCRDRTEPLTPDRGPQAFPLSSVPCLN